MAGQRIAKEWQKMSYDLGTYPGIHAWPDDNILYGHASMRGPEGTPYAGIKFLDPVFHPNVRHCGGISIDILKDQYSPALTLHKCLISVQSLLTTPNLDDSVNPEATAMYKHNRPLFDMYAATWCPGDSHGCAHLVDVGDTAVTALECEDTLPPRDEMV